MTTAWSHLPNARHIDQVLASLKSHPDVWAAAWRDAAWDAAWAAARDSAREAAWAAAWTAARDAAWAAAGDAAWTAARDAAWTDAAWRSAARDAAWRDAALALIAYDDSAKYLDMTSDELKLWGALSEDPAAILLLPAVTAFEQIKELELA